MQWLTLKARLLGAGVARLTGEPAGEYLGTSTAGPSAGGKGSVFFGYDGHRVRLSLDEHAPVVINHLGGGRAELQFGGEVVPGSILKVGFHCPRQAFITVSEGCMQGCLYCRVPKETPRRKTVEEIKEMVRRVADDIDAISLTSGILGSVAEEEAYVLEVVRELLPFGIPVGVSIYPGPDTPQKLAALGVAEVKWNLEAATPAIFARMCPGLDRDAVLSALEQSVPLFGRNHVFSNVIAGLGEDDGEMESCIMMLTGMGVIPVIRPLSPNEGVPGYERPSAGRLLHLNTVLAKALCSAGLDPRVAVSMCTACTGCDLVPGRDS
jgi:biotin synthase-related radical SAM superfamily protein